MTTKMNEQIEAGDIPRVHNWDEVYQQIKKYQVILKRKNLNLKEKEHDKEKKYYDRYGRSNSKRKIFRIFG